MHHFCVLCRVILVPCPSSLPGNPPKRLDWKQEIRAVTSHGGLSAVTLTGVGHSDGSALLASSDHDTFYMSPEHELARHYLNYSPPTRIWTFAFHEACWQLLKQKVALSKDSQAEPQRVAELLFRLLNCLPYDRFKVPCPNHDFGGALRFWKSPLILPESRNFLLADPTTLALGSVTQATKDVSELPHTTSNFQVSEDILARLSPEIVHFDFWKSRFSADREMGFFPFDHELCLQSNSKLNWRRLYFYLKCNLRDESETGHMRNRRRIWLRLDVVARSLMPLLNQDLCLQDRQSVEKDVISQRYELGQFVRTPIIEDAHNYLPSEMDARSFGFQCIILRPQNADIGSRISLSRILFDGDYYISGIRLSEPSESNSFKEVSRVGYIIPQTEIHVSLGPNHCMTRLRVAASASGIVGLSFCIDNGTGAIAWKSIGTVTDPPDGVGVAILEPKTDSQLCGAVIGFDACKIVSLQVLEEGIQSTDMRVAAMKVPGTLSGLWHPNKPDTSVSGVIHPSTPKDQQTVAPPYFLNMDFGGLGGALISRLSRIIALHDDQYGSSRGFTFSYIDGRTKSYGTRLVISTAGDRSACIEQSFSIDGPGGERIVSLEVAPDASSENENISIIKLMTSHDRTLEFRRTCLSSVDEVAHSWQTIIPPTRMPISAILARVQVGSTFGVLQSLGVQYETHLAANPSKVPLTTTSAEHSSLHSFRMDEGTVEKAPSSLRRSEGCFTSVMLTGVRRIGVSKGLPGRTRESDHVAGLCFEFWGSPHPVNIGQWYCEVGYLSLKKGERICQFTFWQEQESLPGNTSRENGGRITGIKINKTGPGQRDMEIVLGDKQEMLAYSFTENPYERLKMGLAWILNRECDYTYVLTEPSEHFPRTSLTLNSMMHMWPNSRAPDKLTWQVEDEQGKLCTASRIHAVFCPSSGKLSGFIFEYGTGQISRTAGSADGVKASFSLDSEEWITGMDLQLWKEKSEVVFYTSTGRVNSLSASGLSDQPRQKDPADYQIFEFNHLESSRKVSRESLDESSEFSGECVGIWVTMKW
ncbi:hypothetical protein FVEG_01661 [Fusarium verticillioides 7600]|uniref:DUF7600 domain-containing protein n=1 Tax=Gibberella moniliformis (strain M3125 / FGSC 7600) TaxID=334819 RepID=W7LGA5_GIBM7|nr:hypothetical protein FVEG_01661 [Fusarium verticillioides 7600]EWG38453.1 hypothetical protein FVEG_01661 [Fusarium verticillioides 7600]